MTDLPRAGSLCLALALLVLSSSARAVERITPRVLDERPHDSAAFTQGLLLHDGRFYESTGLYGQSSLRRVDPLTGTVLLNVSLDSSEFGEGLARVGDRLIQLTYRSGVAHVYDLDSFAPLGEFEYAGQGWGLCFDGQRLVMSNGGGFLYFRDPDTFELLDQVLVSLDGVSVSRLNELECVGGLVYANVWLSDIILRIDARTGEVLTEIDASGLLTAEERAEANVLNGIAFDPETRHFFLTGKLWPKVFEVTFDDDPYGGCEVPALSAISSLELSRDGPGGILFGWGADPRADQYHVNSVESREQLPSPGLHRADLPGGWGQARCDAPLHALSCTDPTGLTDPSPLLFFRVFSACGPGGVDEGPP